MCDLTVIILTYNEEKNIERAISSVKNIAKRVVVVDSGSTDSTCEIAIANGAEVYVNKPFVNQSVQFNWAIDNVNINTTWVLRLDADEQISEKLADQMSVAMLEHSNDDVNGFDFNVKIIFLGKWIRHGGIYPLVVLRLFKFGFGRVEPKNMDEHIVVDGKVVRLKGDLIHYDFKSIENWISKHNNYSNREVLDYSLRNIENCNQVDEKLLGTQRQRKRFLKNGVYYSMPKFWRAWFYYVYRYYFRLGFLDGREGKIFCFLQAYWYRFLVDAKIYESELAQKDKEK